MALSRQTVPLASRTRHSGGERVTAGSVVGEAARRLASVTDTPRLDAEILLVGVAGDLPRVVLRTEKSGVLSRPRQRPRLQECRQVDAAGNSVAARLQIR